jgi:hypothetical protein
MQIQLLKKIISYALEELNNRTCNDINESELELTTEEKTLALKILNVKYKLEDDEDIEEITNDLQLTRIVEDLFDSIHLKS